MSDTATKNHSGSRLLEHQPRNRLYQAQKTYVAFLQAYFASMPPGDLRWIPNQEETDIIITGQAPVPESPHKVPIIAVVRSNAGFVGTSSGGVSEKFLGYDKTFTDNINGTMVVNCIASEGVEAEDIAYYSMIGLRLFRKVLQTSGRIHTVANQIQVGPVTAPGQILQGSKTGWRMVQVFSPFTLVEEIRVTRAAEADFKIRLKEFGLQFDTE